MISEAYLLITISLFSIRGEALPLMDIQQHMLFVSGVYDFIHSQCNKNQSNLLYWKFFSFSIRFFRNKEKYSLDVTHLFFSLNSRAFQLTYYEYMKFLYS